uniref:F-ATPase protein 6 n=1 Tax=Salix viminalis TaxID=40686 RepID=A0A6N2N088_SALVM
MTTTHEGPRWIQEDKTAGSNPAPPKNVEMLYYINESLSFELTKALKQLQLLAYKSGPDYFSSLIETQLDGQNLEPEVMRRCEIHCIRGVKDLLEFRIEEEEDLNMVRKNPNPYEWKRTAVVRSRSASKQAEIFVVSAIRQVFLNLESKKRNYRDEMKSLSYDYANSPLEQFAILPLIPMKIGDLYFSFTNPSFFMLLTLSLVLLLVHFVTKKGGGTLVPNAWQSLVEFLYDFVLNR